MGEIGRNPPPSPERILTIVYKIWAEEHGIELTNIVITKKEERNEPNNQDPKRRASDAS